MSCAKYSEYINAEATIITFDKEEVWPRLCWIFFFFSFNQFVTCKLLETTAKFWEVQMQWKAALLNRNLQSSIVTAGDTKWSGFGQEVLNESTEWVRGSLRTCEIRGLKIAFCIRLDMKENTIIENRARDPVVHCCPNPFQLSSSRVLTAPSSMTLFADVVSLYLLSDHRYIYWLAEALEKCSA